MSENLVPEHLRAIRSDIAEIKLDIRDLKQRVTGVEISFANFMAIEASHYASLASRADRTEERLNRIELRLDLVA